MSWNLLNQSTNIPGNFSCPFFKIKFQFKITFFKITPATFLTSNDKFYLINGTDEGVEEKSAAGRQYMPQYIIHGNAKFVAKLSYDKKMPSEFSKSFTDTTPFLNHDFQSKIALSVVIDLLFQRMNSPFGSLLCSILETLNILKFSIKESACF